MCEPAAQSAEEIEAQEFARAPLPLHARPEEPERVHVQREVPEAAMHEHVRADRPPLVAEIRHCTADVSRGAGSSGERTSYMGTSSHIGVRRAAATAARGACRRA